MKGLSQITNLYIMAVLAVISFYGCGQEEIVTVNKTPLIQLVSVSSQNIKQFKDSVVITFEYKDGDGDIGETDPDKNSIQIKDSRLTKPDYYFIKPLAPPGSEISFKGTIALQIKSLFLLGTANSEITTLELRIKDRAGNWSNVITTPTITINK
jgi:hypothetical protein